MSVIIPCYNCEKYIEETIQSLINQTVKPKEILLIYDHSNDNSLEILKKQAKCFGNIIRIIIIKERKGLSHARNIGINNAIGDYILFMDADDIAHSTLIEKYTNLFKELNKKSEMYSLCYSAYIQIDENNNEISDISYGIQCDPEEILGYEFVRNHIMSPSGVMVKKKTLLKTTKFNEELQDTEDWDLWLRLAQITGFAYVNEPLIRLRRHNENLSANLEKQLNAEKIILMQYDINFIKKAILKRKLEIEKNITDYVSVLFRLNYWEEGFSELIELLKKGNIHYNLYFFLGLYKLKKNKIDDALKQFLKVIEIKNDHGAALNNIGAILLLKGNKDKAKEYFYKSLEYFPNYLDASKNIKLLNKNNIQYNELSFTWRELREVLTSYSE